MNHFLWAALLTVATAAGCHKTNPKDHRLAGNWKLIGGNRGGFAGGTYVIPADSMFILSLNSNLSYVYKQNGRITFSGRYSVVPFPLSDIPNAKAIVFSDRPLYHNLIDLALTPHLGGDTLTLTNMEIEAAPSGRYIRVQ